MPTKNNLWYHVMAMATVLIWGTTFVSTKVLINNGLSPIEILLYRFIIAYLCMWAIARRRLWANNWKDEALLLLSGICGGSLFFIAQNTALSITLASNVSLLTCTAPIATALLGALFYKERLGRYMFYGSGLAMIGVALVVFNGSYLLQINPLGDMLAFVAALLWALFSILLKELSTRYDTSFINRKVFFYGLASLAIYLLFDPIQINVAQLALPHVYLNLLFLGVFASMLCNLMFTKAIKQLGASTASNYIYFNPLITLITSIIVLSEQVTVASLVGGLLIVGGVYWAERK